MLLYQPDERISAREILNILENYKDFGRKVQLEVNIEEQRYDTSSLSIGSKLKVPSDSTILNDLTIIPPSKDVEPTGFFASPKERYDQFEQSISFYREHLDKEYKTALKQANISFALWVLSFSIGFLVLGIGIYLLYTGNPLAGGLTLATETFIFCSKLVSNKRKTF